jgi:hypothetical protein
MGRWVVRGYLNIPTLENLPLVKMLSFNMAWFWYTGTCGTDLCWWFNGVLQFDSLLLRCCLVLASRHQFDVVVLVGNWNESVTPLAKRKKKECSMLHGCRWSKNEKGQ